MANQEQLGILKQGVAAWNRWREENPDVIPDLSGADLNEIELPGADLKKALFYKVELGEQLKRTRMRKANLKGADLAEANLQWVDLSNADLKGAVLRKANLANANLQSCGFIGARLAGANLEGARIHSNYFFDADLSGANLQKADIYLANFNRANMNGVNLQGTDVIQTRLYNTKLIRANLRGARLATSSLEQADLRWACVEDTDFSQASMGGTILSEVDLSRTKGLDETYINSPLVIDFSTLHKSKGQIPEKFLFRAGVPAEMIDLLQKSAGKFSLLRTYIAYSNENHEFMRKLKGDLIDSGVACWSYNLDGTSHWMHIAHGLFEYKNRTWDRLIVVCSREAFGHQALVEALNKEYDLEVAAGRDDMLILACLDDETLAVLNEHNQTNEHKKKLYDFRHWQEPEAYEKATRELVKDLEGSQQEGSDG